MNTQLRIKVITIGIITSSIFLSSCANNPVRKKLNNPNSSYYSGIKAFAAKLDGDKRAEAFYKNPKNHGKKYYYNSQELANKNYQTRQRYINQQKAKEAAKRARENRGTSNDGMGLLGILALGVMGAGHIAGELKKSGYLEAKISAKEERYLQCNKQCESTYKKTMKQCKGLSTGGAMAAITASLGITKGAPFYQCESPRRKWRTKCLQSCM